MRKFNCGMPATGLVNTPSTLEQKLREAKDYLAWRDINQPVGMYKKASDGPSTKRSNQL